MKSGWRHFMDWWLEHRGFESREGAEEALCGLLFNVSGYLHELLKNRKYFFKFKTIKRNLPFQSFLEEAIDANANKLEEIIIRKEMDRLIKESKNEIPTRKLKKKSKNRQ
jgi:hypothetical protein